MSQDNAEFTFVIITDTHVDVRPQATDGKWWNRTLHTLSLEVLSAAVQEIEARAPDFVVHCGDVTDKSDEVSFRKSAQVLEALPMPLHFLPGNHDTYESGSRQLAARLFHVEQARFHRTEHVGRWRLIFIDAAYWQNKDGSVGEAFSAENYFDMTTPELVLTWLRTEFARDNETPTLCFMHPMVVVRPGYPVSRLPGGGLPPPHPVDLSEDIFPSREIRPILAGAACVKAVFSGHGHFHDCVVEDDILYCSTGAMEEYPCEMRLVKIFPNRLETEVFGLADNDCAQQSYIQEWGNDWVAGREQDRSMTHSFQPE